MRTREKQIVVDGQDARVICDSLTVGAMGEIARLQFPRGAVAESPEIVRLRARSVDNHLRALPGEFLVDGYSVTSGLAAFFGARADVQALLYYTLLDAQRLSADERRDLEVAARFAEWLSREQQRNAESIWSQTGTSCAACLARGLADERGCDGVEKKKPVWHDKKLVLKTCPVRAFTLDVEEALRLFHWTHQLTSEYGRVCYRRVALVTPGGVEDQDAWLLSAFDLLGSVYTSMVDEEMKQVKRDGRTRH